MRNYAMGTAARFIRGKTHFVEALESRQLLSTTPFAGSTGFLPGTLFPAAQFDKGGEGEAYHDTTSSNVGGDNYRPGEAVDIQKGGSQGHAVAYAVTGEWVKYTLFVPSAGNYNLQARVANIGDGGIFHSEFDGVDLAGPYHVPNTGSWFQYATVQSDPLALPAGKTVLRIYLDQNASSKGVANFDWFKLVATPAANGEAPFLYPSPVDKNIPAVNYDLGGEGIAYHDTTLANLGKDPYRKGDAVDIQTGGATGHVVGYAVAGEWLQYTLSVPANGQYVLAASVANTGNGGTFHSEFNGVNLAGTYFVPNTGSWTKFATLKSDPFTLAAGQVVLRIAMDQNSSANAVANFESFTLVPFTNYPPAGGESINQNIPAARFNNGGEGVGYHDTTATNLGLVDYRPGEAVDIDPGGSTGVVVSHAVAGEWLKYNINVPASGQYVLQAMVANIAAGGLFHSEFNGANLAGTYHVPNTGAYDQFSTLQSDPVTLTAGQVVLRIYLDKNASNGVVANFDWFKLIPV